MPSSSAGLTSTASAARDSIFLAAEEAGGPAPLSPKDLPLPRSRADRMSPTHLDGRMVVRLYAHGISISRSFEFRRNAKLPLHKFADHLCILVANHKVCRITCLRYPVLVSPSPLPIPTVASSTSTRVREISSCADRVRRMVIIFSTSKLACRKTGLASDGRRWTASRSSKGTGEKLVDELGEPCRPGGGELVAVVFGMVYADALDVRREERGTKMLVCFLRRLAIVSWGQRQLRTQTAGRLVVVKK